MANAISEGLKSGGVEVELTYHTDAQSLNAYDAIIVGAPTYNKDMPMDFKNLFQDAAAKGISLKGKLGAAFGSYGWSGEAPKLVLELMKKFDMQVTEPPLLANYAPNPTTIDGCRNLGKRISESLKNQA